MPGYGIVNPIGWFPALWVWAAGLKMLMDEFGSITPNASRVKMCL